MITNEDNAELSRDPDMEELKQVVFSMSPTSVAGLYGMNGKCFQSCWEVIKNDLLKVVLAFFGGSEMPRYMTKHALFFYPRLASILPHIISANLSGFVKWKSISENIMLAQEIVQGITKPNIGANVVIKLDMAKAYDRVSWAFTCLMLRRMGFNELLIDMI
ncbi:uncharacterized protein LOC142166519 [Nicotiana tabacum]|uniref:Uncharacterized protein LOC142166519 n=1 Tax=Nicotiana tabacum TaxID=4097 RepID=A0AC58SAK4_TOBAC